MVNNQSSMILAPQMPAMIQPNYVDPFQGISAIVGLAQQMGFPIQMRGEHINPKAPDFDQLSHVFRSDVDHLAPLRASAQLLMNREAALRSTRKPFFFPNWRQNWIAVQGSYNAALADAKQIATTMGMSTSTYEGIQNNGGLGGSLLAHIALTEHRQKLDVLHAYRRLAEDGAKYTIAIMGMMMQVRMAMQPGGKLWRPIHDIAQNGSRHEPDARDIRAVRHEVIPKYVKYVARAADERRPLIVLPPTVKDPRPIIAKPLISMHHEHRHDGHHHNHEHSHRQIIDLKPKYEAPKPCFSHGKQRTLEINNMRKMFARTR
ncbi:MAG: hypothetical protein Q7S22_03765 [Candidatus Micrarchaeota archaeon]|nr:hypothetical protein [Candidatus Micrarchaeota archaeon]